MDWNEKYQQAEAERICDDLTTKFLKAGFVTQQIVDGEKVFTLTEKGFQYAKEQGFTSFNDEARWNKHT